MLAEVGSAHHVVHAEVGSAHHVAHADVSSACYEGRWIIDHVHVEHHYEGQLDRTTIGRHIDTDEEQLKKWKENMYNKQKT